MAATQTLSFPNAYRSPDILSTKSVHGDVEDTMMQHTFDSLGSSHMNTLPGATVMSPPKKEEMAQLHYRTQSQDATDLDISNPSSSTVLFPQAGEVSATNTTNATASASSAAAAAAAAKKRMQSCDICRIRKVKCIRLDETGMGKCRQCESNDAQCTYTYVPKKPGPQTSSAKSIARREEKDRQIRAAAAAAMLAKGVSGSGSGKGKGMMKSNRAGTESGGERSSGSSRRSSIPGGQISPALIQQASFDFGVHGHHPNIHSGQNSEGISPVDFGAHRQNYHTNPYPSHLAMSSLMSAYQPSPSGSNSMANSTPSSYNGVSSMAMDNPLFVGQKSRPGSPSYFSASLPFGASPASSSGLHGHSGSNRAACLHSNHSSISGSANLPSHSLFSNHSQPVSASSSRSSSPRLHKIHNTNSTNTFAHAFTPINPIAPLQMSNPGHQSIPSGLHGADALLPSNDPTSAPHGDPTLNFPWPSIPHSNQGMPTDAMAWNSMPQQANPSQATHPFLPPTMPATSSGSNYDPIAMSHQMYEYALQWQQQQQRVNEKNGHSGGETKEKTQSQPNPNQIPSTQQQSEQWSDFWQFPTNHQGPHW
ncbi:uncharacterized protein FA14DRAFT_162256 [Meira miltonrushii]|uniref:Zn(2)-C6 fungal-type domain-containing protein n=1 Tax=Meira miltonrushii TaxID=1280837 RepID=A0A316V378_9BASI|nr:uncharacterized protein FA14DRAFT_162256 [Meira miltonrushii]PWN31912.1 hypothetical protein FA14DRAFT_162256 [Meira miltonrushii]